jgi:hypothetical protein
MKLVILHNLKTIYAVLNLLGNTDSKVAGIMVNLVGRWVSGNGL